MFCVDSLLHRLGLRSRLLEYVLRFTAAIVLLLRTELVNLALKIREGVVRKSARARSGDENRRNNKRTED
jgi:hypothetical protein